MPLDNLSVSVSADTSILRAQLALAQADVRAFGAETRKIANDIRAGGDASGELRGQLEKVASPGGCRQERSHCADRGVPRAQERDRKRQ